MKKNALLALGLILLISGIVLNRLIADFPALLVALIHTCAILCFGLAIYRYRQGKKQ